MAQPDSKTKPALSTGTYRGATRFKVSWQEGKLKRAAQFDSEEQARRFMAKLEGRATGPLLPASAPPGDSAGVGAEPWTARLGKLLDRLGADPDSLVTALDRLSRSGPLKVAQLEAAQKAYWKLAKLARKHGTSVPALLEQLEVAILPDVDLREMRASYEDFARRRVRLKERLQRYLAEQREEGLDAVQCERLRQQLTEFLETMHYDVFRLTEADVEAALADLPPAEQAARESLIADFLTFAHQRQVALRPR